MNETRTRYERSFNDKSTALSGISLRTWVIVALAMILVWMALGYAVLK